VSIKLASGALQGLQQLEHQRQSSSSRAGLLGHWRAELHCGGEGRLNGVGVPERFPVRGRELEVGQEVGNMAARDSRPG
jgi:hypothetical protein